jgi:hypothetical protein
VGPEAILENCIQDYEKNVSEEGRRRTVAGTDVPVLPLLAPGVCIMSREVPKSESIARGLRGLQDTRTTVYRKYAYMRVTSSQVRRTLPGFKSRCRMLLSCCIFPKNGQHRTI